MRKLVVGCLVIASFCFGNSIENLANQVRKELGKAVDTERKNLTLSLNDQDNIVFYGRLAALGGFELERVNKKLTDDLFNCGYAKPLIIIESINDLTNACPSVAFDLVDQIIATSKAEENKGARLTIETMLFAGAAMIVTAGQLARTDGGSK